MDFLYSFFHTKTSNLVYILYLKHISIWTSYISHFQVLKPQGVCGYHLGQSRSRHSPLPGADALSIKQKKCLHRQQFKQKSKAKLYEEESR